MLMLVATLPNMTNGPAKDALATAAPLMIVTLVVAVAGGGIIYNLGRQRRRLARVFATILFTGPAARGLIVAIFYLYLPVIWDESCQTIKTKVKESKPPKLGPWQHSKLLVVPA